MLCPSCLPGPFSSPAKVCRIGFWPCAASHRVACALAVCGLSAPPSTCGPSGRASVGFVALAVGRPAL
eukprot:1782240-Amphidinium_carterae.1